MTIKDFNNYLGSLITGYKFKANRQEWVCVKEDKTLRIYIDIKDSSPHFIRWNGISGGIFFNNVESILQKIYKTHEIEFSYFENTINIVMPPDITPDRSIFDFKISAESDFSYVGERIRYLVEMGAYPFFDKYKTLKDVASLYATLGPEEVSKYIQGMSLFIRTIMVLKESHHPAFELKRDEYHAYLVNYVKTDPSEDRLLKLFEKTFC